MGKNSKVCISRGLHLVKRLVALLGAACLATGFMAAVALTPAAAAPSGIVCTGTFPFSPMDISTGTYSSLSMPAGSLCGIIGDVVVNHGLTLGEDSALGVAFGSLTVNGPVTLGPGAILGDFESVAPINLNGPVSVGSSAYLSIGVETRYGPLLSSIGGPLTANDASAVQVHNTRIGGPVNITGGGGPNPIAGFGANFNDLEDNVISGPVTETGYDGLWSGILRNVMGPLTFTNNSEAPYIDEYDIGSNLINGPATCSDNDPAPNTGSGDVGYLSIVNGPVRGDQAATCTGVATGTSGSPV